MPDREKVIRGLEECTKSNGLDDITPCPQCPYRGEEYCVDALQTDAIALLREQEPVEPILNENHLYVSDMWKCGACGHSIFWHQPYCGMCGRKVKWDAAD